MADLFDIVVARKLSGGGGGGGSSDFSTAMMSFTGDNYNDNVHINAPFYFDGTIVIESDVAPEDGPYQVVIAPSGTAIAITTEATISVSGNIEGSGSDYLVTGDCTITIS